MYVCVCMYANLVTIEYIKIVFGVVLCIHYEKTIEFMDVCAL